jgi:RNA binding exosome subunit
VIRRISLRAFVAATEDEEKVSEALGLFAPRDGISSIKVRGHFGNEIKILEAGLNRKESREFIRILKQQLPASDLAKLRREREARLDEANQFHFRLDKQAAYLGQVCLTESKDAIDVSAAVETYPARREEALRIMENLL